MLNLALGAIERCNLSTKIGYTEIGLLGLNEFSSLPVTVLYFHDYIVKSQKAYQCFLQCPFR